MYALKKNKSPVSEYYTRMRGIWEELDDMSELPILTTMTNEITTLLSALSKQQQRAEIVSIFKWATS